MNKKDTMEKYCECELPIRIYQRPGESKQWACSVCLLKIDPASKMLDKNIEKLKLNGATRNELILQNKMNEMIDVIKILVG